MDDRGDLLTCLFGIRNCGFNSAGLFLQKIFKETIIQELGTFCLRKHGPQEKGQLESIVKGDPVKEEISERFNHAVEGENNPVHELCH